MTAVRDPAVKAATNVYADIHRSLLMEAQEEERDRHPATARKLRYKASIVARAALAEELDPEPGGLTGFRYYSEDRG
jgi:hypothetical protein